MLKIEAVRKGHLFTHCETVEEFHERYPDHEILLVDDMPVDEERQKLLQFVRDAGPVLERCGKALEDNTNFFGLADTAYDLAARAEALLEGK